MTLYEKKVKITIKFCIDYIGCVRNIIKINFTCFVLP